MTDQTNNNEAVNPFHAMGVTLDGGNQALAKNLGVALGALYRLNGEGVEVLNAGCCRHGIQMHVNKPPKFVTAKAFQSVTNGKQCTVKTYAAPYWGVTLIWQETHNHPQQVRCATH